MSDSIVLPLAVPTQISGLSSFSIDANDNGLIVVAYLSGGSDLYYVVGKITDLTGNIVWGNPVQYDSGEVPAIAINNNNVVVEIHESNSPFSSALWYHVGTVDAASLTIDFGGSQEAGYSGATPCIAINDQNAVVEVHQSNGPSTELWFTVGQVTFNGSTPAGIAFGTSISYGSGSVPRVSLNNDNQIMEVHQSQAAQTLWYGHGTINPGQKNGSLASNLFYADGVSPAVALNDAGLVWEAHTSSGLVNTLWYQTTFYGSLNLQGGISSDNSASSAGVALCDYSGQTFGIFGFVSGGTMYAGACMYTDRSQWMTDNFAVLSGKQLWQVTLPGSHDSGTYDLSTYSAYSQCPSDNISGGFPVSVVIPWAQAQNQPILQQLQGGVRFFDIRPCFGYPGSTDDNLHAYHGLVGPLMSAILADFQTYFGQVRNGNELVILDLSHFCRFAADGSTDQALIQMINQSVGPYLYQTPSGTSLLTQTLESIVGSGSRLVVLYEESYITHNPTPGFYSTTALPIFNSYSNMTSFSGMMQDQLQKLEGNPGGSGQLFLLSWTLTPDGTYIAEHLGSSLEGLAAQANPYLTGFVSQYGTRYQINILYVDFYQDARPTELAIALNTMAVAGTTTRGIHVRPSRSQELGGAPLS